jgi:hypothetical protein
MSDDIVTRLRQIPTAWPLVREAADEIERLRLESAIPRDEYAMAWKALLDRIDGLDIVLWLRAYATSHNPSDYVSPIAREVIVRSDRRWIEAADQIERLRNELAARCGDARPGARTAGPSEHFIPEAL